MSRGTAIELLALAAAFFGSTSFVFYREADRLANEHKAKAGRVWAGVAFGIAIYCALAAVVVALL